MWLAPHYCTSAFCCLSKTGMKILVHDYAAHPFPVELSRELARRGHHVNHAYCASLETGPRGSFKQQPEDPRHFQFTGIELASPLDKFSFIKRYRQENEYGDLLADVADDCRPDVVLSGNTPLDAQKKLWARCDDLGIRKVFWLQDMIGLATRRILSKKIPLLGSLIGRHYVGIEKDLLKKSDAVVAISDDFVETLRHWGVSESRVHVIENWAPLDEIPAVDKINDWSVRRGYSDKFVFMYTGTMGMKHDPTLIRDLARSFESDSSVRVVVASKGLGASWLAEEKKKGSLGNLNLMDFHSFDDLPNALGSADVLVAVLEKDADVYSVPSKVLAYLCAGRPVILAVPRDNLAARIVTSTRAGLVVEPGDIDGFLEAAEILRRDSSRRTQMGQRARAYAESKFRIGPIGDEFERVLSGEG